MSKKNTVVCGEKCGVDDGGDGEDSVIKVENAGWFGDSIFDI